MRHIIAALSILQREPTAQGEGEADATTLPSNLVLGSPQDPHSLRPWQLIEPRGKEEMPQLNPGGKYAVKLFWLGTWRKVLVDDLIPIDSENRLLLPQSGLSKARKEGTTLV
jgi:hypothetical protein